MTTGNENKLISYKLISRNGFGNGWNAYPHSMAWFNGEIFVGITKANLCMIKMHKSHTLNPWPIKCPDDVWDIEDRQVEVWAYSPEKDRWRKAYRSPIIPGREGRDVTRDIGYRAMAVFEPNDGRKILCVATWAPKKARDPGILTTENGIDFTFTPIMEGGMVNTFRSLVCFNGKLYIAPTGRFSDFGWDGKPCVSEYPVVLETDDPLGGQWREVSEHGFGEKTNLSIYELHAYGGYLFASTFNPTTGCEVWKTDGLGDPPYSWKKILAMGAYRGNLNEMVMSMCGFNGDLYVGTGIQNGGFDYDNIIGPAAAEIIRVRPDDSWDIVVGEQRNTPDGYKVPLSGYGAGFNKIFNGYIWKMEAYNGYIYAGTLNWCGMLPFLDMKKLSYAKRMNMKRWGIESMMENFAGCHLWRTRNGSEWEPVTQHGFGNPYNQGVRTMTSTPYGLFIGLSNPYGPEIAARTPDGWEYVPNPLGGLEIWQGYIRENEKRKEASTPFGGQRRPDWPLYHWINADFFGYSGFRSVGLWDIGTRTQREACMNLANRLINLTPVPEGGRILQVDSNEGGMVKLLLGKYHGRAVTGVSFSYWKIERCRINLKRAEFHGMNRDATVPVEEPVAAAFAIEPCFYFADRGVFIDEMKRLVKPGGRLALFDLVDATASEGRSSTIKANDGIKDVDSYLMRLKEAGFDIEYLKECTKETWEKYSDYRLRYLEALQQGGHISFAGYKKLKADVEAGTRAPISAFMAVLKKA